MNFNDMNIQVRYRSNEHSIPGDFLIPVLSKATVYKRAVGYFSTSALIDLSIGIFKMAQLGGKIYIVCSPKLSNEDLDAINLGYKTKEKVIISALDISLTNPINEFEEERLNLIATLIANGILEIKLAFMENDSGINIYHEKIAIVYDEGGNRISFTGSMNESENGLNDNFESIYVFCDWKDDQKVFVDAAERDFEMLWDNNTKKIQVINFPQIIIEKLKKYQKSTINFDLDQMEFSSSIRELMKKEFLKIPPYITLKDYQKEAIGKWTEQSYRGIYDMATGTGKSFAALGSIVTLANALDNKLCVFIVCPYIHLVNQWEEDVLTWGGKPIVAHSQSTNRKWYQSLVLSYKRFRSAGKPFICLVTNATFRDGKIQEIVENMDPSMNCLLVIDEVHNFGALHLSEHLNQKFQYRLGLSATVERYMDKEGTQKLYNYFGDKCIEYPIQRAIAEKSLVEYEYYPVVVTLRPYELEEYQKITKQIGKCIIARHGKSKISEMGKQLLFKRSRLIAGAENKLITLKDKLKDYIDKKYILVYCGATRGFEEVIGDNDRQIDQVERMIGTELKMVTHRFTSEEDGYTRKLLKEGFAEGHYQVLTAIKCLDEGVNIPNIRTAFILASSRNPKEFIQRRGRVLRTAEGKDRAVIYDFVTLPRGLNDIKFGDFEYDKSIVLGELARIYEFGRYAINSRIADSLIDEIQHAYSIDYIMDDLLEIMEEGYEGEEY